MCVRLHIRESMIISENMCKSQYKDSGNTRTRVSCRECEGNSICKSVRKETESVQENVIDGECFSSDVK
jgi:arginyl-tRNA--protein-N-Asp/Glu arginylyltransferase